MHTYLILIRKAGAEDTPPALSFHEMKKKAQDTLDYSTTAQGKPGWREVHHVASDARSFVITTSGGEAIVPIHHPPVATCLIEAADWDELTEMLRDHPEYAPRHGYAVEAYLLRTVEGLRTIDDSRRDRL